MTCANKFGLYFETHTTRSKNVVLFDRTDLIIEMAENSVHRNSEYAALHRITRARTLNMMEHKLPWKSGGTKTNNYYWHHSVRFHQAPKMRSHFSWEHRKKYNMNQHRADIFIYVTQKVCFCSFSIRRRCFYSKWKRTILRWTMDGRMCDTRSFTKQTPFGKLKPAFYHYGLR